MTEEDLIEVISEDGKVRITRTKNRDLSIKVRTIALHRLGKYILINTFSMFPKEKEEYKNMMDEIILTMTEDQITKEFNEICLNTIFKHDFDLSKVPIYDV